MDKSQKITVVGLGITGLSVIRFLTAQGFSQIGAVDSRERPPQFEVVQKEFPNVDLQLGSLEQSLVQTADCLILSPGVPLAALNLAAKTEVISDIELFARFCKQPVIAITGSNGKSTVTSMVTEVLRTNDYQVAVGGNLGEPALNLLSQAIPDVYVLELSSFQLETTKRLAPSVAAILNITPDHMDRYENFSAYVAAKQRIYQSATAAVYFSEDYNTTPPASFSGMHIAVAPDADINELNLTFAAAIAEQFAGKPLKTDIKFSGLPHRCQRVGQKKGVLWVNDSKATNVGACLASVATLAKTAEGKVILLAGGEGKQADFGPLQAIAAHLRQLITFGASSEAIASVLADKVPTEQVDSLAAAVKLADELAQPGDVVLLAPACASFDQFDNFAHRGEVFVEQVRALGIA